MVLQAKDVQIRFYKFSNKIMENDNIIRYFLLITANPLSNSKAAIQVFKIIRQIDLVSKEVTVFFPGFSSPDSIVADSVESTQMKLQEMRQQNQKDQEDYHGQNAVYHTYCENAGDMYFNDIDFARFMLDLEDKCPQVEYYGRTEMVVLPAHDGELLSAEVKSYNLEPFFEHTSASLEEFIFSVIKIIRCDTNKNSLELINKIDGLYASKTNAAQLNVLNGSDVRLRIDNLILEHMKWKKEDEIFFVSYSTKDSFYAESLKLLLEKHGKQVWKAPEGIPSSTDYACAIPAAMRISSRFIVVLSHNSAHSPWVRRELGKAISNNIRIDGIFIDGFSYEELSKYDHLSFLFENIQIHYNISDLFENNDMLERLLR